MLSRTRFAIAILTVLLLLFCAFPTRAQLEPAAEGIHWLHDLDEAMQLSKTTGRPVIAFFTFDTCVWCHKLEADTFTDASVIELSRKFIWVEINRDVTPDICKRLNVSAYPSLITFGDNQEKVQRFSGYMLPDEFKTRLNDALRRYALYQAGKEWDDPEPRPDRICDDASITITTLKAPSEEVPAGITFLGDSMWVAQLGSLYECDWQGHVRNTFPLDNSVLDICTDGANIYGLTSGWTAGHPIYVIDPATGKTLRSIITEANKANRSYGAKGIEFVDGNLYVLEGMNGIIHTVDPQTGIITHSLQTQDRWLTSLAYDGERFITGSRDALLFFDANGTRVRSIAMNYPLRSVGWKPGLDGAGDAYVMEQPIFDFDKHNQTIRLWPKEMAVYRLSVDHSAEKNVAPPR